MNGNNALRADTDSARRNTINPLLLLLEDQAARIDELEGRVHDLTLALGLDKTANVQAAFGISESLAQLLIMLVDGKPRSKEQLHAGLFFRRPEVDVPDTKLIDTIICKLRKGMGRYGVEIATLWSSGYRIVAGLEVVRSAMEFAEPYGEAEAARRHRLEYFRERQRRLRAAQGRKDRQTYLQEALTSLRPWEKEGISRSAWERRRRRAESRSAANDDTPSASANHDSQVAA